MPRSVLTAFAAIFAFSSLASNCHADTINIVSSRDNTLYEDASGSLSNGAGQFLFAGRTFQGGEDLRRGLIYFDLSGIPTGATITSVTLTMNMSRTISGAANVALHSVNTDWGEGTSNAGGQEGGGAASTAGDATWIHNFFPGSNWATAGGDFVAGASATTSVNAIGSYNWSSATMISDVQGWADNSATNFGWIVIGNESTAGSAKRFDTHEHPTVANRPTLVIEFTPVPEPSSIGFCAMMATCLLLVPRRKR